MKKNLKADAQKKKGIYIDRQRKGNVNLLSVLVDAKHFLLDRHCRVFIRWFNLLFIEIEAGI